MATSAGHTLIAEALLRRWAYAGMAISLVTFANDGLAAPPPWWPEQVDLLRPDGRARLWLPASVSARLSAPAQEAVRRRSREADVTLLHGIATFALAKAVQGPVVVNEIDPMSLYWRDQTTTATPLQRAATMLRAQRLSRLERATSSRAAAYCLVNSADAADLSRMLGRPVEAIPNGVPRPRAGALSPVPPRLAGRPILSFSGTLSYEPNVDSALVLVNQVLPQVRRHAPAAAVVIAGRRPPPSITALEGPDVAVLQDVPDIFAVHAAADVAVFPGGFGRGTRNSVLEAISAGAPVVASAASARGIALGEHLRVAATQDEIAAQVCVLLTDSEAHDRAAAAAIEAARHLPTWDTVAADYLAVLTRAAGCT